MLWATCPLPTALFTIIAAMVLDFAISHSKERQHAGAWR